VKKKTPSVNRSARAARYPRGRPAQVELARRLVSSNERDSLSARKAKIVDGLKGLGGRAALAGVALNKALANYNALPRVIYLYIDNIAPEPLIENRYGRVYFTIENLTGQPITGQVRATIQPKHSIDTTVGEFLYEITGLPPFGAEQGVLRNGVKSLSLT
jgi:hypothetical protein